MLPQYPKIRDWRGRQNAERIRLYAAAMSPVLSLVKHHIQFEGEVTVIVKRDDASRESPLQAVSAELTTKIETLEEYTPALLEQQLKNAADQIARGISQNFYKHMDEVTAETGNVVDGKGKPVTEELILEAMEKMDHSFGPDGSWNAPTIIGGQRMFDALSKLSQGNELGSDDFQKKRDEHNRREADRILAG